MSNDFKIIILAIINDGDQLNTAMIDLHGKPVLQHVYDCARASAASDIVIATNNTRVGMEAEEFGAAVCMILDEELDGMNCLAQVVDKMSWGDDTVVVNFPADAPLTPAALIDQVADNLITQTEADCATLYAAISPQQAENTETVKLVTDNTGNVLYFSRLPLPYQYSASDIVSEYKCCLEIRAYRAGLLRISRNFSATELDKAEQIEELKLLYNGMNIHAAEAGSLPGQRLITEEDIEAVKALIAVEN